MSDFLTRYNELKNSLARVFVAPPGLWGIDGWEFSILRDRSIELKSEISDYLLEDGSRVQDHISLDPITLNLSGFIGEVLEKAPRQLNYEPTVQSKLNEIAGFLPQLSVQGQQQLDRIRALRDRATRVISRVDRGIGFLASFPLDSEGSSIVQAFSKLRHCWQHRVPLTVRTEFCDLDNMYLQSVKFSQNGEEKYKADLTIVLKQITTVAHRTEDSGSRVDSMKSKAVNLGNVGKDSSVAFKLYGK
jgi:hypothetical protein